MKCHAIALLLCAVAFLSACSSQPALPPESADWSAQRNTLQALTNYRASGKIALRSDGSSETASFDWRQQGTYTELQVHGPLGLQATQIVRDGAELRIERDGSTEILDLNDTDTLRQRTGWELPLDLLPAWLRGLPGPAANDLRFESGRLVHFSQSGWAVAYPAYGSFDGLHLPTRIELQRADTRARLLIRRWEH